MLATRSDHVRRGLCLVIALFAGSLPSVRAEDTRVDDQGTVTYRLLAYNVASAAGVPFGDKQIGQMADTIIDNAIDVAGFTEMETGTAWHDGRDHVAELCVALADRGYPMHVYKWPVFRLQQGWFTPAILSRLPIEESGHACIDSPFSNRWCIGHVTVNVAENTPIRVHMTHMWPAGDALPYFQEFMKIPSAFDGPATIMGDFNLGPDSHLYPVVGENGFTSSCVAVHGRPCPTVQGMAGISGPLPLGGQIDYIFGNGQIEFVDTYVGYYSLSDHWPVIAEVRVKASGPMVAPSLPDTSATRSEAAMLRAQAAYYYRKHAYAEAARAYRTWETSADSTEDAGFAGYSAAMMHLLDDSVGLARREFERVIAKYTATEWSARSHYRLAFLDEDAEVWAEAIDHFEAWLSGYYEYIHRDVKAPLMRITAPRIVQCRKAMGEEANDQQVLKELAAHEPESKRARAAAFELAMSAFKADDRPAATRYLLQADPHPLGAWPSVTGPVAEIFLEAGQREKADLFYAHFLRHFDDPLVARVREARWTKRTRPEDLHYDVPRVDDIRIDGRLDEWPGEPIVILHGTQHASFKDPRDAVTSEARVRLGHDEHFLYVAVDVADREHTNRFEGAEIWRGDCLQIAIDPAGDATQTYNEDDIELGAALTDSGIQTHFWVDRLGRDWSRMDTTIRHHEGRTYYEVAIPQDVLAVESKRANVFGMNLLIGCADSHGREGWLDWTPGIGEEKAPALYPVITLRE